MGQQDKMIIPRYPDKDSDPKSPTFHDWQSREIIAESKRDAAKKAPKSKPRKTSAK